MERTANTERTMTPDQARVPVAAPRQDTRTQAWRRSRPSLPWAETATTLAVGEEGPVTTLAAGEESGDSPITTMALGEESTDRAITPAPSHSPFGEF